MDKRSEKAGAPRRWVKTKDHLFTTALIEEKDISPEGGYRTLWECMQRSAKRYSGNNALGTRQYLLDDSKSSYQKGSDKLPVRGNYVWETYSDFDQAAREIGAGLIALGCQPKDNIGIFSENRAEWVHTAYGCYSQSMRVVALYATLGEDAVEYIVNHAEIKVVFVSKDNMQTFLATLPKMKTVTHIIQYDVNKKYNNIGDDIDEKSQQRAQESNVKIVGLSELLQQGMQNGGFPNPPKPDDLAMIMYTSGTTGKPSKWH